MLCCHCKADFTRKTSGGYNRFSWGCPLKSTKQPAGKVYCQVVNRDAVTGKDIFFCSECYWSLNKIAGKIVSLPRDREQFLDRAPKLELFDNVTVNLPKSPLVGEKRGRETPNKTPRQIKKNKTQFVSRGTSPWNSPQKKHLKSYSGGRKPFLAKASNALKSSQYVTAFRVILENSARARKAFVSVSTFFRLFEKAAYDDSYSV